MNELPLRVLILCTGNSARSQMAETILRHLSNGEVEVVSAGSHPELEIHPFAREAIRQLFGLEMTGQYPKSINDFAGTRFDSVITVCDRAAQTCPTFPGAPEMIRWSFEDPDEAQGSEETRLRAFENTASGLTQRIRLWLSRPEIAKRTNPSR
jgi:arsenate reductase